MLVALPALLAADLVRAAPGLRVDVPAMGCPRRKDVVAALEARLPGVTRSSSGAGSIRRLALEATDVPGVVQLRLWDDREVLALERRMGGEAVATETRGKAHARSDESCQALAEAIALVVDRYLRDIGYHPAAASVPAPASPADVSSGAAAATAADTKPGAARPAPATPAAGMPVSPPPSSSPSASAAAPSASAPGAATAGPSTAISGNAAPASGSAAPSSAAASTPSLAAAGALATPPGRAGARPSAIFVGLGGGARLAASGLPAGAPDGDGFSPRGELLLRLGGHRGLLAAEIGAGITAPISAPVAGAPGAELRLRAVPLRMGIGAFVPAPRGAVVLTGGLCADLLWFEAVGLANPQSGLGFDPAAELGAGYLIAFGRLHLRASLVGGLTLAPRDFQVGQGPSEAVYRTPTAYLRGAVEVGWSVWKNYGP